MKYLFTIKTMFDILVVVTSLLVGSTYYYYSPLYKSFTKAVAVIHPTQGNSASGVVTFVQEQDGLHITAHVTGLQPGKHGFHIHEFGDCTADDASSAGEHYNPTDQPHAGPDEKHRHVGDLGNIVADDHGNATYSYVDTHTNLNGPDTIIGRSIIVHEHPDDLVSQPTGDAGARLGCGVIGVGK